MLAKWSQRRWTLKIQSGEAFDFIEEQLAEEDRLGDGEVLERAMERVEQYMCTHSAKQSTGMQADQSQLHRLSGNGGGETGGVPTMDSNLSELELVELKTRREDREDAMHEAYENKDDGKGDDPPIEHASDSEEP